MNGNQNQKTKIDAAPRPDGPRPGTPPLLEKYVELGYRHADALTQKNFSEVKRTFKDVKDLETLREIVERH